MAIHVLCKRAFDENSLIGDKTTARSGGRHSVAHNNFLFTYP